MASARRVLGTQEGIEPEQRQILSAGGDQFDKFFQSTLPTEAPVPDPPDPEIEARRRMLIDAGASEAEAAGLATNPSLTGDFLERAGAGGAGSGPADQTGQRQRVLNAARELTEIAATRPPGESELLLRQYNDRIKAVFEFYGLAGIEDLQTQMRALGVTDADMAPTPTAAGPDPSDPLGIRN